MSQEIMAIDLAQDTRTGRSTSIRDSFGLHLNKTASDLIKGITGGIYTSMSIDENLNVFMNTPTKRFPIDQVSSGTMDQIYLALRLAAALDFVVIAHTDRLVAADVRRIAADVVRIGDHAAAKLDAADILAAVPVETRAHTDLGAAVCPVG